MGLFDYVCCRDASTEIGEFPEKQSRRWNNKEAYEDLRVKARRGESRIGVASVLFGANRTFKPEPRREALLRKGTAGTSDTHSVYILEDQESTAGVLIPRCLESDSPALSGATQEGEQAPVKEDDVGEDGNEIVVAGFPLDATHEQHATSPTSSLASLQSLRFEGVYTDDDSKFDKKKTDQTGKFAEEERRRAQAKTSLENCCSKMKNELQEKLNVHVDAAEREQIEESINDALRWLVENPSAEKGEIADKQKELESIATPIIMKARQAKKNEKRGKLAKLDSRSGKTPVDTEEVGKEEQIEAVPQPTMELVKESAQSEARDQPCLETEEQPPFEAEEQARLEAEEQARLEAEEQGRLEAEEQARLEAEEQARLESEEQKRLEAEEQERLEAEEASALRVKKEAFENMIRKD